MTAITYDDAIKALASLSSTGDQLKTDLLALADKVSVYSSGSVTVLYSGPLGGRKTGDIVQEMIDSGQDIRAIKRTDAFRFLDDEVFLNKVAEAFGVTRNDIIRETAI